MRHFFSAILMLWVLGGGGIGAYQLVAIAKIYQQAISSPDFLEPYGLLATQGPVLLVSALLIWLGGAVLFGTLAIVSAVRPNY